MERFPRRIVRPPRHGVLGLVVSALQVALARSDSLRGSAETCAIRESVDTRKPDSMT